MTLRCLWIGLVAATTAAPAFGAPVREFEMKFDGEPVSGKQVVTVRFTPGETKTYEQMVFECVLRQEYTQTDSLGRQRRRVVEPATFVHRERGVRFVEALDKHISFWVPIGVEQLKEAFGDTLFVAQAPVTIQKIVVKAFINGEVVWALESRPGAGPQTPVLSTESEPRDKYGLPPLRKGPSR